MKKFIFIIVCSALFLGGLFVYQTGKLTDARLHMVFCDVGQGDGILIRTPEGADIIIDGGPANGKMLECLAEYMPLGDRDIELMIATHPDADHIGGLTEVLRSYEVLSFGTSDAVADTKLFKTLKELIAQKKIPERVVYAGDRYSLTDGVVIETLWPKTEFTSGPTNDHSLVQIVRFGEFRVLLTGDATYQILNSLTYSPNAFHVLKIAHHGSKTGTDATTLEKIKAHLAVISDGKNNSYHHPHPSVLNLLQKYGVTYKRTDQVGSIEIISDGKTAKVLN